MGFYPILVVETLRQPSAVFPPLKWDFIPFQGWKPLRRASAVFPPLKWDFIPFQRWKSFRRASAVFPLLKWDTPHIWGVSHVHGGQRPISLEYQINPPPQHIWYSSNWNDQN